MKYYKINLMLLIAAIMFSFHLSSKADIPNNTERIKALHNSKTKEEINEYYKKYHHRVPKNIANIEGKSIPGYHPQNNNIFAKPIGTIQELKTPPDDMVIPGEFEENQAVLVSWPYYVTDTLGNEAERLFENWGFVYNSNTDNYDLAKVIALPDLSDNSDFVMLFLNLIDNIQEDVPAWVVVNHLADSVEIKKFAASKNKPFYNVKFVEMPCNSFWFRDCGPMGFYYDNMNKIGLLDFEYYPGRPLDDQLSEAAAKYSSYPILKSTIEYEGGNILLDGNNNLFTSDALYTSNKDTEGQYYLNQANGQIEKIEKSALTNQQCNDSLRYIMRLNNLKVLPHLKYDGGTGHIDLYADMCNDNGFVFTKYPQEMNKLTDYKISNKNIDSLISMHNSYDANYSYKYIPVPRKDNGQFYTSDNAFEKATRTFSNHLILNKSIIQPVFHNSISGDIKGDSVAIEEIKKAYPGYKIKPIDMRTLDGSGGSIHCITKQIPAENPIRIFHRILNVADRDTINSLYKVTAQIQSNREIKDTKVFFRYNAESKWDSVNLIKSQDGKYTATIKCVKSGDKYPKVEYYISASNDKKTMTSPMTAPDGYYVIESEINNSSVTELNQDLKVYPNPAKDQININLELSNIDQLNVRIIDNTGKDIYSNNINNIGNLNGISINTNMLSQGNYMVIITNKNNISQTAKFSVVR